MTIQASLSSRSASPGPRRRSRSVVHPQQRRGRSTIRREDPRDRQLTPAPMKYCTVPTVAPSTVAAANAATVTSAATSITTGAAVTAAASRGRRARWHLPSQQQHVPLNDAMTVTTSTTIPTIETASTAPSTVYGTTHFAVFPAVSPTSSSSLSSSSLS